MQSKAYCAFTLYLDLSDTTPVGFFVEKGAMLGAYPGPEKEGYLFGGWFTDRALTKPYNSLAPIMEDTELFPLWLSIDKPDMAPSADFTDISHDPDHWTYKSINWAVSGGITCGTSESTFSPDDTCTRAQAVTFLYRAMGGLAKPVDTFSDVSEDSYYAEAVAWAVINKITLGMSETTFGPDEECTRGQIVTFLWRAAGCPTPTISEHSFVDVEPDAYYYTAVLWAVENKITNGRGIDVFAPDETCTRAEIVTFLYRTFVQ